MQITLPETNEVRTIAGALTLEDLERLNQEFEGRTAFGDRSEIPFNVSSIDWQESDRLMASFMTAFGKPTGEIAVGGRGQLNGVMLGEFV